MFVSDRRARIAELLAAGRTPRQIAHDLGLAGPTVDYHIRRLLEPEPAPDPERDDLPTRAEALSHVGTREPVRQLLDEGYSKLKVARMLEISQSTVSYHARRLGVPVDDRGARRYDWKAVQAYYDAGHSVRECIQHFGFSSQSWHAAKNRGALVTRPTEMPIEELCANGIPRSRNNLRRRLLEAGLKQAACEECGLSEWRGQPIPLSLHHKNGDRHDNRLENLELLCGNCHGQTENFAGRNRPKAA